MSPAPAQSIIAHLLWLQRGRSLRPLYQTLSSLTENNKFIDFFHPLLPVLCLLQLCRDNRVFLLPNGRGGAGGFRLLLCQRSMFRLLLCSVYDVLRLFVVSVVF